MKEITKLWAKYLSLNRGLRLFVLKTLGNRDFLLIMLTVNLNATFSIS